LSIYKEELQRENTITQKVLEHDAFYALVRKAGTKKKRPCIRCKNIFISEHIGNRQCCNCLAWTSRQPDRSTYYANLDGENT